MIEPGQEAFKGPEVLTRDRVLIWLDTRLEPDADCGSVICPSHSHRLGGRAHVEAQGGRATVCSTFYRAGLVLPSGSSSSESAFGQQQIETGQTLPPWSCQSALRGTALTLTGVKHVVLVEALF